MQSTNSECMGHHTRPHVTSLSLKTGVMTPKIQLCITGINQYILNIYKDIENSSKNVKILLFYCTFDQINVLVRPFFRKV